MEITEKQLRLILVALEDYFRLRMGQTYIDLVDDMCLQNIELPEAGEERNRAFNEFIWRRDTARDILQEFYIACLGRDIKRHQKTPEMEIAIDMWSEIRHWLWEQRPVEQRGYGVDSYPVYQFGEEPLPRLERRDHVSRDI